MRRILLLYMALVLIIAGCNKKNKPVDNTVSPVSSISSTASNASEAVSTDHNIVTTAPFTVIEDETVRKLRDMVLADAPLYELFEYINNHIKDTKPDEADKLYLIAENLQNAWLEYYRSSFDFNSQKDPEKAKNISDELKKNGFHLITIDNTVLPIINYEFFLKNKNYLSDWYSDYISIVWNEVRQPSTYMGNRNIPVSELETRLTGASDYIGKYPDSIRINDVFSLYEDYIFLYLYGCDNEQVFDPDTNKISMERYNSYKEFTEKYTDSDAVNIVIGYINLIEKGEYYLTEDIMNYLESVFSNLNKKKNSLNDIGRQVMTERLCRLLPEKTGFEWNCSGFADYKHNAVLESIAIEDGNPVYTVSGTVENYSYNGVSDENLMIYIKYKIENNILTQVKNAPLMMDSEFINIEIIRYPFVVGHKWIQYPIDEDHYTHCFETEIISVSQDSTGTYYEIEYRDVSNGKKEMRLIQTGKGTVGFTRLCDDGENEPYYIGYTIIDEETGYVSR